MFKTKVYVRLIDGAQPLVVREKGDWIDLCANGSYEYQCPTSTEGKVEIPTVKIPLGVAMKLPKGFEAPVLPRSSTHKTYSILPWNCMGLIDNAYNGTNDEWQFGALCLKEGKVNKGDRICQFRIQLSQKATVWQKIKWLLSGGKIEFIYVDKLSDIDRKGFGKGTGTR